MRAFSACQYRGDVGLKELCVVRLCWIAMPAGKLWALEQYDYDDDRTITSTAVS